METNPGSENAGSLCNQPGAQPRIDPAWKWSVIIQTIQVAGIKAAAIRMAICFRISQLPMTSQNASTPESASDAFASCQVEKVFRTVCLRNPQDQADRDEIATMAGAFRAGGYKLKQVFADAATYCMGD